MQFSVTAVNQVICDTQQVYPQLKLCFRHTLLESYFYIYSDGIFTNFISILKPLFGKGVCTFVGNKLFVFGCIRKKWFVSWVAIKNVCFASVITFVKKSTAYTTQPRLSGPLNDPVLMRYWDLKSSVSDYQVLFLFSKVFFGSSC